MKFLGIAFALSAFCVGAAAQSPPPQEKPDATPSETTSSQGSLSGGTVINAELNSSVDSKKAKTGAEVVAHTTEAVKSTDGRMILPKNTKLVGHVTQASAHEKGQEGLALLAIKFDKAKLKDGQEMSLTDVKIQAVAAPEQQASNFSSAPPAGPSNAPGSAGTPANNPSMSGSRGARPESTPTPQQYPNSTANPDAAGGTQAQAGATGPLPAASRGVFGIDGVRMGATQDGQATVLTSTGKNVHLDSGTRLLLVVQPQASAPASPSR